MTVNKSPSAKLGQLVPVPNGLVRADVKVTSSIEILRQEDGTVSFLCTRLQLPVFETFLTADQVAHLVRVLTDAINPKIAESKE